MEAAAGQTYLLVDTSCQRHSAKTRQIQVADEAALQQHQNDRLQKLCRLKKVLTGCR